MSFATEDHKIRICFVCKEPIPFNSLKMEYCSKECAYIGRKIKTSEYHKEMTLLNKELGRCTYCGRELDSINHTVCFKCREKNKKSKNIWKQSQRLKGGGIKMVKKIGKKPIKKKMEKKKNPWQIHLSKVYKEMKAKNADTKLSQAMTQAKKSYIKKK